MNLVAVVGSPRKGKATDILVDKAIEGFMSKAKICSIRKIHLMDYNIQFCRNCLSCREDHVSVPLAECIIKDDMESIRRDVLRSDTLILATPVHMGYATAVMMTFLERICWTFAQPGRRVLTIEDCPFPRGKKRRKVGIIVVSGIVSPIYRLFCDRASSQIRGVVRDSLNGKVVGELYAGDVEHRGVEPYFDKAYRIGKDLV